MAGDAVEGLLVFKEAGRFSRRHLGGLDRRHALEGVERGTDRLRVDAAHQLADVLQLAALGLVGAGSAGSPDRVAQVFVEGRPRRGALVEFGQFTSRSWKCAVTLGAATCWGRRIAQLSCAWPSGAGARGKGKIIVLAPAPPAKPWQPTTVSASVRQPEGPYSPDIPSLPGARRDRPRGMSEGFAESSGATRNVHRMAQPSKGVGVTIGRRQEARLRQHLRLLEGNSSRPP